MSTEVEWGNYRDVPVCKYIQKVRERQLRDLARSYADPSFPYYFDEAEADRAVEFFSYLRHFEGDWRGQRFYLSDWQEWDIVRPLYGWKRRSDGLRRFRDVYIEMPRKNGKSTLLGGMAALGLVADREYGAQVYCAATKEAQARIVWDYARRMMELSPELYPEIRSYRRSIVNEHLGSCLKPLGRDSKTDDGLSVHLGIVDEYHAHRTSHMYDVLSSGRGARRQPMMVIITTAGLSLNTPCKKESDYAKKVLDGLIENDTYFAFVATVDDPENWRDPVEWQKANPNWGISIYPEGFISDFNKADQTPSKQNEFKTKRLNIWCGQAERWIPVERLDRCAGKVDWSLFRGRRCFAGLDLGISRDLSALSLAFLGDTEEEQLEDGTVALPNVYVRNFYWVPAGTVEERTDRGEADYPEWINEGLMLTTPGETTRYDLIHKKLNELRKEYEIAEIAVDRAHAHQLMTDLSDDGWNVVDFPQSMKAMTVPCKTLEELILAARLRFNDDKVFRWMIGNVALRKNAKEEMMIAKDKSGGRVDGVVSAAMAIGRLFVAPEPKNFIYNSRGVFIG